MKRVSSRSLRRAGKSLRTLLAATALFAGLTLSQSASAQLACPQANSAGPPVVNSQHFFCGEINAQRQATGFHSRPGGHNPATVTGTGAPQPVGPAGIYNLTFFNITQGGNTAAKAISTMFPDACTQADVLAAIRNALANGVVADLQFTGPSGHHCQAGVPLASFNIKGSVDDAGRIVTAYPDY